MLVQAWWSAASSSCLAEDSGPTSKPCFDGNLLSRCSSAKPHAHASVTPGRYVPSAIVNSFVVDYGTMALIPLLGVTAKILKEGADFPMEYCTASLDWQC